MILTKTKFIVTPASDYQTDVVRVYGNVWTMAIVHMPLWAMDRERIALAVTTPHEKLFLWRRSQIKLHS